MTRQLIIDTIMAATGCTKAEAATAYHRFTEGLVLKLQEFKAATIPDIGTIKVVPKAARTGRNPATGEPIQIAAKNYAKLEACKSLRGAINS